ncbi:anthrone oxygenase family protein [Nocardia uniformis]|nr:anthrone oxygenase family protein [Nocardia uniformis]
MNAMGSQPVPTRQDSRMGTPDRWLTSAAAVATAINAGVFFDFSFVVMPGLRELPAAQGISAMQAFNRSAVTPPLMLMMYVTAVLCVVLIVRALMRRTSPFVPWILAAAIAFLLASVAITGAGNVPLSASIDALDPAATESAARWDELFAQWVRWNHVRVLTSIAAAVGFVIALRPPRRTA